MGQRVMKDILYNVHAKCGISAAMVLVDPNSHLRQHTMNSLDAFKVTLIYQLHFKITIGAEIRSEVVHDTLLGTAGAVM